MGVTIEWNRGPTGTLRFGPTHHKHGDFYDGAGTLEIDPDDPTRAEVKGFVSMVGIPLADWLAFRNMLRPRGIEWLWIERRRGGRITRRCWRL